MPGIGFSVEPGIYLSGEFGIRSEVNMFLGEQGPEVTPTKPQMELILAPRS
jgi:Xaa-Pro aminopeptidase